MVLIAIQLFIAFALHAKYESVEGDVGAYFTDIVKNYTVHDNSSHEFMHRLQRKVRINLRSIFFIHFISRRIFFAKLSSRVEK